MFYYSLPTDNVSDAIVPTVVEGTVDASWPVANLANDNLAQVMKAATLGGGVELALRFDFTSTVGLRFFSLHNFNLDDSVLSYIRLISDSSSDIFTPVAATTFTVTYGGLADDGFSIDPYLATALAGATARRYWYVVINTNSGLPKIGRIWMSPTLRSLARSFTTLPTYGYHRGHPATTHKTGLGVNISYPYGTREEVLSGQMIVDATDYAALKTLFDVATPGARAFPIVPDSVGTPICSVAAEVSFVRFPAGFAFEPRFTENAGPGLMYLPLQFEMVARGLAL